MVDIEGDHLGLDNLRGVLSVGGVEPLPKPDEVEAIIIEPTTTPGCDRRFTVGARRTTHVRHWHKYARYPLDPSLHFQFRSSGGQPTGSVATSLYKFHHILRQSAANVIEHHLARNDFSRWILAATKDAALRDSFAECENVLERSDIDTVRQALVQAIEHRNLE